MRRILFSMVLVISVIIWASPAYAADSNVKFTIGSDRYVLNGVEYPMDATPYISKGRTYIPLAYAAKAINIPQENVIFKQIALPGMLDSTKPGVTFVKDNLVVTLEQGVNSMLINDNMVYLREEPQIVNGRMYLPIVRVAEIFGFSTEWDAATQTVTLREIANYTPNIASGTCPYCHMFSKYLLGSNTLPYNTKCSCAKYYTLTDLCSLDVKGFPPVYTWKYQNRTYTLDPKTIPSLDIISTPQKALTMYQFIRIKFNWVLINPQSPIDFSQFIEDDWMNQATNNYTGDPNDREVIGVLSKALKELAAQNGITGKKDLAQFVISFVQSITYTADVSNPYDLGTGKPFRSDEPYYPSEVYFSKAGDCEDTAMLAAVLLREMGYNTALIAIPGHMKLGVEFDKSVIEGYYYDIFGKAYFNVETTDAGWKIGEMPQDDVKQPMIAFPLMNPGKDVWTTGKK